MWSSGGDDKCIKTLLSVNLKGRDHLRSISVDERIILKCIFKKWDMIL
jgi:hypothetical protein